MSNATIQAIREKYGDAFADKIEAESGMGGNS